MRPLFKAQLHCDFTGCEKPHAALGLCHTHWAQARRGIPLKSIRPRRQRTPDGWTISTQGYEVMTISHTQDPSLEPGKTYVIYKHRLLMEAKIGRRLTSDETVHHINGVRNDNRIENLELWSSSHPRGQRVADKVAWAKEILKKYEEHHAS